jgi:tripeptidyl-peptidase I
VIGLLNDLRLSSGKTPLGFLNPWIYKSRAAFNDVTTGSNPGCGTQGFQAAAGWDPGEAHACLPLLSSLWAV